MQAILRTGEPITGIEVNGQRPDGSNIDRVWITYWHPLKNKAGNVVGINVAAEEITERKRTEADLAASQDQLRNLNETLAQRVEAQAQERDRIWKLSQDLLVVNDSNGIILHVNPAWSVTLGWSPEDLVGKSGEWLIHPDDRERSMAELPNLVAGLKTRRLENRIICKDGSYRWLSWSAVPDRGFIYANARDITDLKQAQEQLDTLRHQLARCLAADHHGCHDGVDSPRNQPAPCCNHDECECRVALAGETGSEHCRSASGFRSDRKRLPSDERGHCKRSRNVWDGI